MSRLTRRGVSTIVGALAALPAFLLLALALLSIAAATAEEAARARERLQVIPVVSDSVLASLVADSRVVVKYIVVRDLVTGEVWVIPGPFIVEPGRPLDVTILEQVPERARLDVAVVSAAGSVFRWDPLSTGDFILDIPGEPVALSGLGSVGQASKLEIWLMQQGFPEPAVCSLVRFLDPQGFDRAFPPTLTLGAPYDAEASASAPPSGLLYAYARVNGLEDGGPQPGDAVAGVRLSFSVEPPIPEVSVSAEESASAVAYRSSSGGVAIAGITVEVLFSFQDYTAIIVNLDSMEAGYLSTVSYIYSQSQVDRSSGGAAASVSLARGEPLTLERGLSASTALSNYPKLYLLVYQCP